MRKLYALQGATRTVGCGPKSSRERVSVLYAMVHDLVYSRFSTVHPYLPQLATK